MIVISEADAPKWIFTIHKMMHFTSFQCYGKEEEGVWVCYGHNDVGVGRYVF